MANLQELGLGDLDSLLALNKYLHHSDAPLPSDVQLHATWVSIINDPKILYFGIFIRNHLIACCHITLIPNLTRGARPYGVIENVVTHPDYRKQGHATKLLKHALDTAWSQNCYKVMLMTGRKDESVYKLYENAGFQRDAKQAFIAYPKKIASDKA